jgi:hypothetical protein
VPIFQTKKPKTEFVSLVSKDWRDAGPELEKIGEQLDAIRSRLAVLRTAKKKKNTWAIQYWSSLEDVLLRKWKQIDTLKQVGLRQEGSTAPKWTIDYSWWESTREPGGRWGNFGANMVSEISLQRRLEESWARSKELSFQKARQGLG